MISVCRVKDEVSLDNLHRALRKRSNWTSIPAKKSNAKPQKKKNEIGQ